MQCENLLRLLTWPYAKRCKGEVTKVLHVEASGEEVMLCDNCAEQYVEGEPISYPRKF
jgi:hypothetical protein